jgi:hypothetical protein
MSRNASATGFMLRLDRLSDCACPFCKQAAPFAPAVTREFRPYKPHPAGLLHICATWSVHPSEVLMIGDSAKDDVRSIPPSPPGLPAHVCKNLSADASTPPQTGAGQHAHRLAPPMDGI